MIDVTVVVRSDKELATDLRGYPASIRKHVRVAIQRLTLTMLRAVKLKLTGPVLNVKTGLLRRSINQKMDDTEGTSGPGQADSVIRGTVGTNKRTVPYAAIHEFGGVTRPHVIMPKNKKVLRFASAQGGFLAGSKSGFIFAAKVNHPGSRMPERSYLRSTLREIEPSARVQIAQAVAQAIKAKS